MFEKYRLLIADDEENILEGMRQIIPWDELGFQVAATAYNGAQALEIIGKQHIDAVLTDIRMRPVDGIELSRMLHEKYAEMPVVVLSAYRDFEYARNCMEYGVCNYLLKPVDEQKLTETMRKVYSQLEERQRGNRRADLAVIYEALLNSGTVDEARLMKSFEAVGIPTEEDVYCCLYMRRSEGSASLREAEEYLKKHQIGMQIHSGENSAWFICYTDGIYHLLDEFSRCVSTHCPGWHGYIGKRVPVPALLHYSCISAKNMLLAMQERMQGPILAFRDFQMDLLQRSECVQWSIEQMQAAISFGTLDDVLEQLEKCRIWLQRKFVGINDMRAIVLSLMETLWAPEAGSGAWMKAVGNARTLDQVMELLREVCAVCYERAHSTRENSNAEMIRKVEEIIRREYGNPQLSIKHIARSMGYNSSYLGRAYTLQTGRRIKDAISAHRIEVAKRLLRTSKMKIIDVAMSVGITDLNLFYRLFRELVQCTPTEYRNQP